MWLMTRLAIIFYVTIIWITSIAVTLFVLHSPLLSFDVVNRFLNLVYNDDHIRAIVLGITCVIVIISFVLENLIYGRRRKERTIAFDNPSGQVSVSLSALEDLIKALSAQVTEVKEIRPVIMANKKGLDVAIKLVLRQETNIPELTARLQDLVRRKIEDAIGMEGRLRIRIHVIKMALEERKGRKTVQIHEPHVPFHGYRA